MALKRGFTTYRLIYFKSVTFVELPISKYIIAGSTLKFTLISIFTYDILLRLVPVNKVKGFSLASITYSS